ncbi:MAG: hypothetical protein IIA27_04585 [Gemmatimonadetes bacterium]|nr:hypothetical protein [Gemmatimonadota bacterium]
MASPTRGTCSLACVCSRGTADTSVVFHFSDGQRYDFLIQDVSGDTLWGWSASASS